MGTDSAIFLRRLLPDHWFWKPIVFMGAPRSMKFWAGRKDIAAWAANHKLSLQ
jgi:hypothetical protein